MKIVAKFDFAARNDKELPLKKGDTYELEEENDNGWWLGSAQDGTRGDKSLISPSSLLFMTIIIGYFPWNYVDKIETAPIGRKLSLSQRSISTSIRQLQKDCGFRTIDGKQTFNGLIAYEDPKVVSQYRVKFFVLSI